MSLYENLHFATDGPSQTWFFFLKKSIDIIFLIDGYWR